MGNITYDTKRRHIRRLAEYSKSLSSVHTKDMVHTVAEKCDYLSPNSATIAVVSPFSATVALFCDSVDRA